jgi:hypothetical protein
MRYRFGLLIATLFFIAPAADAAESSAAWPSPVPGWKGPARGEYPRLLFRRGDIPALRQRAATPEGRQMIAHLKTLLGGGETMPTQFSNDPPVNYVNQGAVARHPIGTFTLSHGTGFGLLYVLTGDRKYAELARQCLEKIFEGQVDRDSRYNWTTPGTGFRLSFVLQSICLTYDLCADAWPPEYRRQVVERVMNMNQKKVDKNKFYTLEHMARADGYPPGSNHYGAYLLGPGLVALTFMGEPGADDKRLASLLVTVEQNLNRVLGGGFGDGGWFAEGTSCGRIAANNGVLPLLQSLRVAAGKDYISPRPHGRYTVLRLMHEITPSGERVDEKAGRRLTVPSRPLIPHRGDYGDDNLYTRPIISHMGDFAHGMGAVLPLEAQAMAWIYDNFVEPGPEKTWNSGPYPHLLVYSFVNWPAHSLPPDEVFPRVIVDDRHGYYLARNRWRDANDLLVTTLLKRGPSGYKSGSVPSGTIVWGLGQRFGFGGLRGNTSHFRAGQDGSMELADDGGRALVVDFSGASGAPALIAHTGAVRQTPTGKARLTALTVGGTTVNILTLSEGEHPVATAAGNTVSVGQQILNVAPGRLTLETFAPAP